MKVSNRACIRNLSLKGLRAARTRNLIAVLAIALTTVMFTSLFTIAASINHSFQQENFRMAGGDMHASIKNITWEQAEQLRADPLVKEGGARLFLGMPEEEPFNKSHVEVSYMEPQLASHYFCVPVEGSLPREGTDEAATDTRVLGLLGVEPKVGEQFTVTYNLGVGTGNPKQVTQTFTLSGWWEYDEAVTASNILLPQSRAEEALEGYQNQGRYDMNRPVEAGRDVCKLAAHRERPDRAAGKPRLSGHRPPGGQLHRRRRQLGLHRCADGGSS